MSKFQKKSTCLLKECVPLYKSFCIVSNLSPDVKQKTIFNVQFLCRSPHKMTWAQPQVTKTWPSTPHFNTEIWIPSQHWSELGGHISFWGNDFWSWNLFWRNSRIKRACRGRTGLPSCILPQWTSTHRCPMKDEW